MAIIALGAVTAILLNYWVVEGLLAEHSDPTGSWISDLGARSESTGWLFGALDSISGLALCALTALLWSRVAPRSRLLHGFVTVGFASATLDGLKGSFQRPAQVVLGVWVALLAAALAWVPALPRGGRAGMLARR